MTKRKVGRPSNASKAATAKGRIGGLARAHSPNRPSAEQLSAWGSKGGAIGGKRRLVTLSAARRKAIARAAINARWARVRKEQHA